MSAPATGPNELMAAARAGDRRALGRLLTQVEDGTAPIAAALRDMPVEGQRAHLVGITGPPGAGKSSLVNALVAAIRADERPVAVLAVDPSSPITGGAILGDRVRMQQHARDTGVFIRSMASRGHSGGLAAATRDAATVLAHSGFDLVLIETVGAGQGEVAVAGIVDTTVVVEAPGMGDEIQALKAGMMELADVVVVSKADLPGADQAASALRAMLTVGAQHDRAMGDQPRPRRPEVLLASATEGTGITELLAAIDRRRPSAGGPIPGAGPRAVDTDTIELRPLTAEDDRVLYLIFRTALDDLGRRQGDPNGWPFDIADDAEWERWRPMFEHIRSTADLAWGAESDGRLVGYARSIRRGDDRELTEFFVVPEAQGRGVGARLLERAFPADAQHRSILASTDATALSRYLRLGLVPSATVHLFEGPPAADPAQLPADVVARPLADLPADARMDALAAIDAEILGMRRDVDHAWLGGQRPGWLLERAGAPVGYAYGGPRQGPVAVLDPSLLVGAVGLLEAEALRRGEERIVLWVSLAGSGDLVRYVLGRGYRIDPDPLYLLEDPPLIRADRYLVMSPPFHL
ncbi:MAG: methylmalonyl Co-A mutase-associated GTPase MeaB [Candidatus Limnocylindrales bacterium]